MGSKYGKNVYALAASAVLALMIGAPAFAHQAPCDEAAGPGHSEFAQHHKVPLAQVGGLATDIIRESITDTPDCAEFNPIVSEPDPN